MAWLPAARPGFDLGFRVRKRNMPMSMPMPLPMPPCTHTHAHANYHALHVRLVTGIVVVVDESALVCRAYFQVKDMSENLLPKRK